MHLNVPTPTQSAAMEQRRKFHAAIEARAVELRNRAEMTAEAKRLALMRHPASAAAEIATESFSNEMPPPIIGLPDFYRDISKFPLIDDIIYAVADYYRVERVHIVSDLRSVQIILPRHMAMYLARELTPFSLLKIGRKFRKDHTAVHYACNKIELMRASHPDIAQQVSVLTSRIQARVNARGI